MKKILLLVIVATLVLCGCMQTKEEYMVKNFYDLFSRYNVVKDGIYIVEKDEVYSVVNSLTGEVYIDGGYLKIEKITDESLLAKNDTGYHIIAPTGEAIKDLGEYQNIRLYNNADMPRLLTYNEGYYTLLDGEGELIGDYGIFDHLELNTKTNDCFVIQRGSLYTVINEKGNQIANLGRYEELVPAFNNDAYIVMRNGKKGVINSRGSFVIQPSYHNIWVMNKNGCYALNTEDSFGVADTKGKVIVPVKYDGIEGYKFAFVAVKDGLYGAFDIAGKEILPCESKEVTDIKETETEFTADFINAPSIYSVTANADGFAVEEK